MNIVAGSLKSFGEFRIGGWNMPATTDKDDSRLGHCGLVGR